MTTTNELIRRFTGPTLRELVEKGDYKQIQRGIVLQWAGMILAGIIIGITLVRSGFVPV